MNIQLGRSVLVCVAVLMASGGAAQSQSQSDLKARCSKLISFYDYYGVGRSENSDGARNHTRIAAGMECAKGNYQAGIADMEDLLRRKGFDVPPASAGMAETPMERPPGSAGPR